MKWDGEANVGDDGIPKGAWVPDGTEHDSAVQAMKKGSAFWRGKCLELAHESAVKNLRDS